MQSTGMQSLFAFSNGQFSGNLFSRASNPKDDLNTSSGNIENAGPRASLVDPNRKKNFTLPVTLRSVMNCEPHVDAGHVTIHGKGVHKLLTVSQVMEKKRNATSIELTLADSTGYGKCLFYIGDEGNDSNADFLTNSVERLDYIKVLFTAKKKDDGSVVMTGIMAHPVPDPNEIPYHLLEAIHCGLQFMKGTTKNPNALNPPTTSSQSQLSTSQQANGPTPSPPTLSSGDVQMTDATASTAATTSTDPATASVAAVPTLSLDDFFKIEFKKKGEIGYTVGEFTKLGGVAGYDVKEIETKWEEKLNECELFPSIDDEHFALVTED